MILYSISCSFLALFCFVFGLKLPKPLFLNDSIFYGYITRFDYFFSFFFSFEFSGDSVVFYRESFVFSLDLENWLVSFEPFIDLVLDFFYGFESTD